MIAFVWCYKTGIYLHQITPITLKKHGRQAKSIFKYGLDLIANILLNAQNQSNIDISKFLYLDFFHKSPFTGYVQLIHLIIDFNIEFEKFFLELMWEQGCIWVMYRPITFSCGSMKNIGPVAPYQDRVPLRLGDLLFSVLAI